MSMPNPPPLKLYRHTWGIAGSPVDALDGFAAEGYAGVETLLIEGDAGPALARRAGALWLDLKGQWQTAGATVADHIAGFREGLRLAESLGARTLVAHSGRDAFDEAQARAYFAEAMRAEADSPVEVAHETHRGRILFNPWRTRDLLREFDALHLCCDLSHFCVVCERLGWDEAGDCLPLFAQRCRHVHARVGYEHGPQVPDPSAPEAATAVSTHFTWWDALRDGMAASGQPAFTVTPEFGPSGYLHTLPHTNVPVADLPTVVRWMADRLVERYGG